MGVENKLWEVENKRVRIKNKCTKVENKTREVENKWKEFVKYQGFGPYFHVGTVSIHKK